MTHTLDLQSFISGIDPVWQWLAIMLAGAIPFVESYFAGPLGILIGVNPVIAIIAAILGNIISMILFVFFGDKINQWRSKKKTETLTPRKQKFKDRFDKYGIAGVSLLGQTILPSQITSAAMVSFGAKRNLVIFWQIVSITIWGVAFGLLALAGVSFVN